MLSRSVQGPLSCAFGQGEQRLRCCVVFQRSKNGSFLKLILPSRCIPVTAHVPVPWGALSTALLGHVAPGGPCSCHQRVVTAPSISRYSGTRFPLSATGNHCNRTDTIFNERGPPLRSAELIRDAHLCRLEQHLCDRSLGASVTWSLGLCPRGLCPAAMISSCFKF